MLVNPDYPGMAVEWMHAVWARVVQLAEGDNPNGHWEDVWRKVLWAGGLRDLPDAIQDRYHQDVAECTVQIKGHMPLTHILALTHGIPFSCFVKRYTGHSFNNFNHMDLTTMLDQVLDNENDGEVCLSIFCL
jgi:hypothetical protein